MSSRRARGAWIAGLGLACTAAAVTTPAFANSAAIDYFRTRADSTAVPSLLSQDDRAYYQEVFDAIDNKEWSRVQQMLAVRSDGPLHQQALAEYYLAAGSPKIELPELQAWLANGTELPGADQISRLALKRGADSVPQLPTEQQFARLPSMPRRTRPASINDGFRLNRSGGTPCLLGRRSRRLRSEAHGHAVETSNGFPRE